MTSESIRGLDSPQRLLAFFKAKGQTNLVLRVVDMLDMRNVDLQTLITEVVIRGAGTPPPAKIFSYKGYLTFHFPLGYVVAPMAALLEDRTLVELEFLQAALAEYKSVRYHKGEPTLRGECLECLGLPPGQPMPGSITALTPNGVQCRDCNGARETITWLELDATEMALAMGSAP